MHAAQIIATHPDVNGQTNTILINCLEAVRENARNMQKCTSIAAFVPRRAAAALPPVTGRSAPFDSDHRQAAPRAAPPFPNLREFRGASSDRA